MISVAPPLTRRQQRRRYLNGVAALVAISAWASWRHQRHRRNASVAGIDSSLYNRPGAASASAILPLSIATPWRKLAVAGASPVAASSLITKYDDLASSSGGGQRGVTVGGGHYRWLTRARHGVSAAPPQQRAYAYAQTGAPYVLRVARHARGASSGSHAMQSLWEDGSGTHGQAGWA